MHLVNGRVSPALAARLRAQDAKLAAKETKAAERAARRKERGESNISPDEATRLFWDHVNTSGGPAACHPWAGAVNSTWASYTLGEFIHPSFETKLAHRVAVALTYGHEPPRSVYIVPSCENRLCCNVDHLMAMPHERGGQPIPVAQFFCKEVADGQTRQAA